MAITSPSSDRQIEPARILEMAENDFVIGLVRAAYPFLTKGKTDKNSGRVRYTMSILMPPGTAVQTLITAAENLIKANIGDRLKGRPIPPSINRGIRFVDKEENYKNKAGYDPGWSFMGLMTYDTPPGVVDAAKNAIDRGLVYPGCWVRVRTKAFWFNTDSANMGISWGLNSVQFMHEDRRIDSRIAAEDAFPDWEDDGQTIPQPVAELDPFS